MISEHQEELAALYALGLLTEPEHGAFAAELAATPELRATADALAGTAAELAALAPPATPSPALRARVLAAVAAPPSSPAPVVPFASGRLFPWAAAAVLALTAGWLARQNTHLSSANETLRSQQRLGEIALETARNQLAERSLLAEHLVNDLGDRLRRSEDLARLKVSALASLAGNSPEARAIAVWDPDQQAGLLTIESLPAIAANQDYQIWVIDPAYLNPVNGGVFHVAQEGSSALAFRPDQPVAHATAFAISLERKGGVPKAEGPIVLLGKLPSI